MRTTKLTRKQKLLLAAKGLKPENWQLEKETPELLYIVSKDGRHRLIKKEYEHETKNSKRKHFRS